MKKKTLAVLSAAVLAAAVMAGCSNKAEETTAPATTEAVTEGSTETPKAENKKAQLVIAGGDGSGLVAAVQAVKEGMNPAEILILQTNGELGADLSEMDIYMNACNTDEQYDQEIEDSPEVYLADILKSGSNRSDEELAEYLAGNSEEALVWLRDNGIELEGVTKQEGSSMARSFASVGEKTLPEALTKLLIEEIETLKIPVMTDVKVEEILLSADGSVSGLKVTESGKEEIIDCTALIAADKELLPLLEKLSITVTKDAEQKTGGVLISTCAEMLDEEGTPVMGLYAVGSLADAGIFGDKALAGDRITAAVLFGSTAATEAGIYVADNQEAK